MLSLLRRLVSRAAGVPEYSEMISVLKASQKSLDTAQAAMELLNERWQQERRERVIEVAALLISLGGTHTVSEDVVASLCLNWPSVRMTSHSDGEGGVVMSLTFEQEQK